MSQTRPSGPVRPHGDIWFVVVALLLAAVAAILWLNDPRHGTEVDSRVPWPEAKPAHP